VLLLLLLLLLLHSNALIKCCTATSLQQDVWILSRAYLCTGIMLPAVCV
jgi:hypothetical protein